MLKRQKNNYPELAGIYLFKSKNNILYIGKAKNLAKRISQYFQSSRPIIKNLLNKADIIEYVVTKNETDALHLEYNLIQTYRPPYNIKLKDDKSFPYIKISQHHKFPGIFITRKREDQNQLYFGPLLNKQKGKSLIDIITGLWQLRTCSDKKLKQANGCLYQHIDRCSAPCTADISEEDYKDRFRQAVDLLKGNRHKIISKLEKQMMAFADSEEYEKAQKIKEDILVLKNINLKSYITTTRNSEYDVIACRQEKLDFVIRLSIGNGRVRKRYFYNFNSVEFKDNILKDFLVSCYCPENLPPEIVLPFLPEEADSLQKLFSSLINKRFKLTVPQKGTKKSLLLLAIDNLNRHVLKNNYSNIGEKLKQNLLLNNFPNSIECFDISHLAEQNRVGAKVAFYMGEPQKKKYRNYLIKKAGQGDLEALREVLKRRFKNTADVPDLIVIDGGAGQLLVAREVKAEFQITSDIVSLAKKEERVFLENGKSILLPQDSPQKFFFQNIRDEAHRRAITHHRKRREKALLSLK